MATSWIRPIHNSGSLAATLRDRTAYVKDPNKTEGYEFVTGFGCNPQTAANEFLLNKRRYEKLCKRSQDGKHDVVAYHVRVSFPLGEVTPGEVLEIGQEIADSWLKGKHQYIVAAHTNTNNPHCHIIYNNTTIDCRRKFRNFLFSSTALRRLCDITCLQHGLSIIEKPGKARGFNRGEYVGDNKPPTVRDQLRETIDKFLAECNSWEEFITAMTSACEVKRG
ncbi:hypothetical protein FACS1894120_1210 [Clostridia bacterium]|nr:hypothetical protein FACS1894120_1210 [Clostridia bacterium]